MTLILIDNGAKYSDHIIHFFTASDSQVATMKAEVDRLAVARVKADGQYADAPFVIMVAKDLEWYRGDVAPAHEFYARLGWVCPQCSQTHDGYMDLCWSDCGAPRPTLVEAGMRESCGRA